MSCFKDIPKNRSPYIVFKALVTMINEGVKVFHTYYIYSKSYHMFS